MAIDDLFALRELRQDIPTEKIEVKQAELERRLQVLDLGSSQTNSTHRRKPGD